MVKLKIAIFALLIGIMNGSCAFSEEVPNSELVVTVTHLKAQPWSSSCICLAKDQNSNQVCIEVSSELQDNNETFTPNQLDGIFVYYSGDRVLSLGKKDLDEVHSPILHLVKMKPSWKRLKFDDTKDYLDLEIPYGFIQNREICFSKNNKNPTFSDSTSTVHIRVFFNGNYEIDTSGPNCLL